MAEEEPKICTQCNKPKTSWVVFADGSMVCFDCRDARYPKPTITELEALLDKDEDQEIEILPNGEVRAVGATKSERKPLTFRERLGGEYQYDPTAEVARQTQPMLSLDPAIIAMMDQGQAEARERLKANVRLVPQDPTDIRQVQASEFIEAKLHDSIDSGEFQEKLQKLVQADLDRLWYGG